MESEGTSLFPTNGSAFLTYIAQVHDRWIQDCKANESHRCNCLQVNPPEADRIVEITTFLWKNFITLDELLDKNR